ncbi:MAG: L,D-transpeptidase family protein [Candidatus Cloacimonetes bacterium]|nr:L,D-transpeptidase family protein [Candidatus Cloacimonadota bacterium]
MKALVFVLIVLFCMSNILFSQTGIDEKTVALLEEISNGAEKVILARPIENGYRADIQVFSRSGDVWQKLHHTEGYFGRNGVTGDKMEGDGATPSGVFTFGRAFGMVYDPGSLLSYTKVTDNDVWVDDVNSRFYNQWSYLDNPEADWDSAEHLIKYPNEYKYVLTINYNTDPIIIGKGSAIFLHCSSDRPTAGCISVSEATMIFLLGFVDSETIIGIFQN